MRSIIYRVAASERWLARARRRAHACGVSVFMYHDIGPDGDDGDVWQVVRQSDFRAQMRYLYQHYDVVSVDDALGCVRSGRRGARPLAVVTFDDGLIGNFTHLLPIVRELRLPVMIYVATAQVEAQSLYWFDRVANLLQGGGPLTIELAQWALGRFEIRAAPGASRWAQIQQVLAAVKALDPHTCDAVASSVADQVHAQAPGSTEKRPLAPMTRHMIEALASEPLVTIGGHSHGHEILPLLTAGEARDSIRIGKERLEAWTGRPLRHFAYPAGRSDAVTRSLVAELGFETAMGTRRGMWNGASDLMEIPRISIGRYDCLRRFKVHAAGGLSAVIRP